MRARTCACGGQRVATVVVYLADVEEGGETRVPGIATVDPARVGAAAYFEYFDRQGLGGFALPARRGAGVARREVDRHEVASPV